MNYSRQRHGSITCAFFVKVMHAAALYAASYSDAQIDDMYLCFCSGVTKSKVNLYTRVKSRLGSFFRSFLHENIAPCYKRKSSLVALSLPETSLINPRRACAARVTVLGLGVCLCVCVMPYFLDTVSLHVERKVLMASVRHCADYYKKGFRDRCFIQKLWCHLLTRGVLGGYCSVIPRTFSTAEPSKGPKKANNRLNAT